MIPPREPQEEQAILDRWSYSGLPSVAAFNHAVDVANANYRENAALRGELARLQQWCAVHQYDFDRAEAAESARSAQQAQIRALVEKWEKLAACEEPRFDEERFGLIRAAEEISALLIPETPSEQG